MTRIANHFIKRHNLTAFNTSWAYSSPVAPDYDRLAWQYHTWGYNVDTGKTFNIWDAPKNQVYSPIGTTSVGPNDCVVPGQFWPNTRNICTRVLMDAYINYAHRDGYNGERSLIWFDFKRPMPPKVTLTRTQTELSWAIDAQSSQMGDTTVYNRQRTRWYKQRITKGQSWPTIPMYDTGGTKFYVNNATVTHSESSLSPTTPVKVRIVCQNDGFTGASDQVAVVHTFSIPNKPTITGISDGGGLTSDRATIKVRSNTDNDWYPVDKLILERQVASVCDPSVSWTRVGEYTSSAGIKALAEIADGQTERIPPTDKATWYRVKAIHDEDSNATASNILPSTYTNKPTAPTISSTTWNPENTITMSVTKNSSMHVKTYVQVTNMSTDAQVVEVPAYEVTDDLSNFMILQGGQPKYFDVGCVYRIDVFNRVVNDEDLLVSYGDTPMSNVTSTTARGSAGAIAKATLSTPEITELELTKSGRGVMLSWVIGEETFEMTYDEKGTLIEWTDADGGWLSTEAPKQHKRVDDGGNGGTVFIDGLTEGNVYQIRLRRYVTLAGEDGYGAETTTVAVPWSTPDQPTLTAPGYVLPGESVRYTWTFTDEGDTPQSSAILTVNGFPYAVDGSNGSYVLDVPDSMEGETLTATVRVACNGGYSDPSDEVVTTVAERPTCTLSLPTCTSSTDYGGNTLTALPLSVTVGGSGDTFRVHVTSSVNALSPEPSGGRESVAGEVVASDVFAGEGTYDMDGSLILGGGNYDVTCVCVDTTTGMESEPVTVGFSAVWADEAVIPTGTVKIEDGMAYITPVEGADAPEGETCRIWRKTADGYVLACERAIWGERHLDRVPSYGSDELAYVIEAVSADGDHKWAEVPYSLSGTDARITFGGQTVSLPWNLQPKSTYAKGFERRAHMDGHRAGFWEPGVNRDWALSSGYLRDDRAHTDELREVGRYDGLCYVRGPRGVGFAANVDVDVSLTYDNAEATVDITCAEVEDDGTFAIVVAPSDDDGEGA